MPERAITLLWGLAGLAVVAVLALCGVSLRRAARSGPAWKRRLVAAGLLLAGGLGFQQLPGCTCYAPAATSEQMNQWAVQELKAQAEALETLRRDHPANSAVMRDRFRTIESAATAARQRLNLEAMSPADRAAAEALYTKIQSDLRELSDRGPETMCYAVLVPMVPTDGPPLAALTKQRAELLSRLVEQGKLDAAVAARVRGQNEA
jgi:hypothetical protein